MFLLCSRQSLSFPCTLYIIFCLNCSSNYSMVTKFYCNIISSMYMLAYYDPSSLCFYILIDESCVTACHLKNYLFVITYLLEDEQELSLGMLIHCKCIYNFLCSMLVLLLFLHVLCALLYTFYHFRELTY